MTAGEMEDLAPALVLTPALVRRFTVLNDDVAVPTVAHVSGAVERGNPSKARDQMEVDAHLDASATRRRLSVSGGLAKSPVHEYRGQRLGKESSAYVFGQRDAKKGWSFHAQIVKGNMSTVPEGVTLTDNLQVLGYVSI